MIKLIPLYILLLLFFQAGAFADTQSPSPDDKSTANSLLDQQKQTQDVADLAQRSAQLYQQIADIADDSSTVQTKKKMEEVDYILRNMKKNKERLLHQMQEEQYRRQQEQLKAKLGERRADAERLYHDGLELLRSHDYAKAKIKFLVLENIYPDFKETRRYLGQIDEDLKKANVEAVTTHEKLEAEHLNLLQDKENTEELRQAKDEQEKQFEKEQQQQASLKQLAQKASDINDEIIRLSHQQDYEAMKAKFKELEDTVAALTVLKDEMAKQSDRKQRAKELAHDTMLRHDEIVRVQKREDKDIHAYEKQDLTKPKPIILSSQPSDAQFFKRREIMQEQNMLFSEGVDRYEHKKYSQAKLLFGELADQHDRRAEVWLGKVDRAITRELLKSQIGEEKERTAFLEDQLNAQRELLNIQKRERLRQKKLTEELEHQKRLFEDDRLLQLRKEEIIKAQDRERQRQETKRLQIERANEKHQEMFRFHKIEALPNKPAVPQTIEPQAQSAVVAPSALPVTVASPASSSLSPPLPPAMTALQLRAQAEAEARQKRLNEKQQERDRQKAIRAQREEERQARIKARQEARQKRIEERQKERQHQLELKAQREAERQARLKTEEDARQKREEEMQKEREHSQELQAEQEKEQNEKKQQDQKRREEILRQQQEQRDEKIKQEEIMREDEQRREEIERQERQRQDQLSDQREAVRKQLEDGVEAMYQDALSLYQQGDYSSAADRFKDVQDIIPGYKRSEEYIQDARQKALNIKTQAVTVPQPTENSINTSSAPAVTPDSPPVSRQDSVTKALDLFDPNAK